MSSNEAPPAPQVPEGGLGPRDPVQQTRYKAAGKGVSLVVQRCEASKANGVLDLKDCELVTLPDAIYLILREAGIKQLSLAWNHLKKVPRRIPEKFPDLQVLSFKGNQIEEIPSDMESFAQLMALDMADNQLAEVHDWILLQPMLKILNLANNKITEVDIDAVFTHADKLQMLNLTGNPLNDATLKDIANSPHKKKVKVE